MNLFSNTSTHTPFLNMRIFLISNPWIGPCKKYGRIVKCLALLKLCCQPEHDQFAAMKGKRWYHIFYIFQCLLCSQLKSQMLLFKAVTADIAHIRFGGRTFSSLCSGENFAQTRNRQTLNYVN